MWSGNVIEECKEVVASRGRQAFDSNGHGLNLPRSGAARERLFEDDGRGDERCGGGPHLARQTFRARAHGRAPAVLSVRP